MLDSNLIIYGARPEYPGLRRLIAARSPAVSAISVVEVLGYHKLSEEDRRHFAAFFAAANVLPISDAVVARAVSDREGRYSIGGLTSGAYLVIASDPNGRHVAEWYREATSPTDATPVKVEPGQTDKRDTTDLIDAVVLNR